MTHDHRANAAGEDVVEHPRRYDIVVAGGGNAALCAAIAARRAGASVLVLEAADKFYRSGAGCYLGEAAPADRRRLYHRLTFCGFLLCFASTVTATLYHYLRGRAAPYAWVDLPVVLGTLGGIGLVVGPLAGKSRRDLETADGASLGMDAAFLAMLLLTGLTGERQTLADGTASE